MTDTPNLGLPFIEGSQAQKHITHNEALRILDAAIQMSVLDTSHTSPPVSPAQGERHVVASGATGAWSGHVNAIATWQDGAWAYLVPHTGWCVWSVADDVMLVFDGTHWRDLRNLAVDNVPRLGVNTTAGSPNLFSVKSNAALLAAINAADGGSGDARLQISKESAAKTASVFFSDAFSGRAEFGLAGSDAFKLKVSPDGSSWIDAFSIDQTSGNLTLPRGLLLSGVIAPAQITANQNDYNPAGMASAAVIQLSTDAARSLSGLAGGPEGRVLCLLNVGTQPLVLLDQSTASAAANRFALGSDLTVAAKQAVMLRYDGAASRWQAIAGAAGLVAAANNLSDLSNAGAARANLGIMFPPQGRLTLQSGVAVMATTQSAKTTLYYTPYAGNQIPLYDGAKMVPTVFAELAAATTDTLKSPAAIGAGKVNDWFVWNDGGTLRLGHGPDWTSDTARSAGTALVMVNGIWLNNASITNGPAAQRGTYVGTTRSDGSSQLNWTFGAAGVPALLYVWNAYNRVRASTASSEATATWNYTSATARTPNGAANARVSFVSGLAEEAVLVDYVEACNLAAVLNAYCSIGFALDSTTVFDRLEQPTNASNAAVLTANVTLPHAYLPQLGAHFVQALEGGDGTNAATFIGGAKMNLRLTMSF